MGPEQKILLSAIQQSLKIERSKGAYQLSWKLNDKGYSHIAANDDFLFYKKGDSIKSSQTGKDDVNYRRVNWRSALNLWQAIFKTSGLDINSLNDDEELSFGNYTDNKIRPHIYVDYVIAGIFSGLVYMQFTLNESIQVLLCILALLKLASCFETVHLRTRVSISEKIIISAGSLLPVWFGEGLIGMIPVTLALYLVCRGERQQNISWFFPGGVLFGLGMLHLPWFTSSIFVTLLIFLLLVTLVDRHRLKINAVLFMAFGYALTLLVIIFLIQRGMVVLPEGITSLSPVGVLLNISLTMLVLAGMVCAGWWIIGVQYYLMPWLVLISLFVALAVLSFFAIDNELYIITCATGWIVFVFLRLLGGFIFSKENHPQTTTQ